MVEVIWPFFSHCIERFGAHRCLFESNFPVDRDTIGYRSLWNCFKKVANRLELTAAEKAAIFHDTALR